MDAISITLIIGGCAGVLGFVMLILMMKQEKKAEEFRHAVKEGDLVELNNAMDRLDKAEVISISGDEITIMTTVPLASLYPYSGKDKKKIFERLY